MSEAAQESTCPRCGGPFHCGVRDDEPCWCARLTLDAELRARLEQQYVGCLCGTCLTELSREVP